MDKLSEVFIEGFHKEAQSGMQKEAVSFGQIAGPFWSLASKGVKSLGLGGTWKGTGMKALGSLGGWDLTSNVLGGHNASSNLIGDIGFSGPGSKDEIFEAKNIAQNKMQNMSQNNNFKMSDI